MITHIFVCFATKRWVRLPARSLRKILIKSGRGGGVLDMVGLNRSTSAQGAGKREEEIVPVDGDEDVL
jgi:hypothetical protein